MAEIVFHVILTSSSRSPRILFEQILNSKTNLKLFNMKTARDVRKIIAYSNQGTRRNLIQNLKISLERPVKILADYRVLIGNVHLCWCRWMPFTLNLKGTQGLSQK